MRISDWSSDVCSSDLSSVKYARMPSVDNGSLSTLDEPCLRCSSTATIIRGRPNLNRRSAVVAPAAHHPPRRKQRAIPIRTELGSASCRESVCQYVYISVSADALQQKQTTTLLR